MNLASTGHGELCLAEGIELAAEERCWIGMKGSCNRRDRDQSVILVVS